MTKPFRPVAPLAAATLAFLAAAPLGAQQGALDPQCAALNNQAITRPAADACQKAVDLFAFMAPQLGASITGGNPVLGSGGTLGGLGHFTIGLRANVIAGQLPRATGVTLSAAGPQRSDFAPERQWLGLPSAEAAVGLFKGIPLGLTNVLGVDALLNAFYVPDFDGEGIDVSTSGGSLKVGYGVRVGVLQETAIVPGVSVSVLRRDLPTVTVSAAVGGGDSVRVRDLRANTTSWRAVVSKRIMVLGLAAGVGQDRYDSEAIAGAFIAARQFGGLQLPAFTGDVTTTSQKLTRTNVFANASLVFPIVRITGEIGQVRGGSAPDTYNAFGGRRPTDAYTYGSVGARIGF